METDNFQTLSPGFGDTNSPESLFTEEASRKRPFDLTFSGVGHTQGCVESDTLLTKPPGFIINKPATMENFRNQPDFSSAVDQDNPMGESLMFTSDQTSGQLDFVGQLDNSIFQMRPMNPEEDEEEVQSQSDLSPPSSPGTFSPHATYPDNTCLTLINQSEGLQLDDTAVDGSSHWTGLPSFTSPDSDEGASSRKVRKSTRVSDASTSVAYDESEVGSVTEAQAHSPSDFSFMKFGQSIQADTPSPSGSGVGLLDSDLSTVTQYYLPKKQTSNLPGKVPKGGAYRPSKKLKEPALNLPGPARIGKRELKILTQPEEQHRARYLTEGSRGAIKDRSQNGFPVVKLCGYEEAVKLQIFIGNDTGKVKPHGFYQACQVCGKNASQSVQKDIDGTTVIEMQLDPSSSMTATVDCVGILKLRNADVEKRIGLARSKKKSTKARLVFRINIPNPDGTYQTLQVASSPILCTQPAGAPEICKKSLSECDVKGGEELFIIGKNFSKGTHVIFRQEQGEKDVWTAEADIDQDYFHQTHMIVTVPAFHDQTIREPVSVLIQVHSSGRVSEACTVAYVPAAVVVKKETSTAPCAAMVPSVPMDLIENAEPSKLSKSVSPVALEYNKMFEQAARKGTITSELLLHEPTVSQPPQSKPDLAGQQVTLKQELTSPASGWMDKTQHPAQPTAGTSDMGFQSQQRSMEQAHGKESSVIQDVALDQIMEVIQPKTEQVATTSDPQQGSQLPHNSCRSDVQMTMGQQASESVNLNLAVQQLLQHHQQQQKQLADSQTLQQLQQVQGIHSPAEQFTPKTPHTPHTPNFTSPPPEMVLQERKESISENKLDLLDCIGELNKLQEEAKAGDEFPGGQGVESQTLSPEQTFQTADQLNQSFTGSDYEPQQQDSVPGTPGFSSNQFQDQLQESPQAVESASESFRQQEEAQTSMGPPQNTAPMPVLNFTEPTSSGFVCTEAMDTDTAPRQTESVLKALLTSGTNPGASLNSGALSSNQPMPQSEARPAETSQQQELTSASTILDELVQYLNEGEKDNVIHDIINNDPPVIKLEAQTPAGQFEGLQRREQSMETLCSNDTAIADSTTKPGDQGVFNLEASTSGFTSQNFHLPTSVSQAGSGPDMVSWAPTPVAGNQPSVSAAKLTVDDFITNTLLQTAMASSTTGLMNDVQKEQQLKLEQQCTEQQKQQQIEQQNLQQLTQQQLEQQKQQVAQQQQLEQRIVQELEQHLAQQQQQSEQRNQQQLAQQQLAQQQQLEQQKQQQLEQQQQQQLAQQQLAQQQQMEQRNQQIAQQLEMQKRQQLAQQLAQQQQTEQQKQMEQQKQQIEQQKRLQEVVKLLSTGSNNGKTYAVATTGPQGQTIIQLIPSSQVPVDQKLTPVAPKPEPAQAPTPRIDLASLLMQRDDKPSSAQMTSTTSVFTQRQPIMANSTDQTPVGKASINQAGDFAGQGTSRDNMVTQLAAAPTQGSVQTVVVNLPASVASQTQTTAGATSASSSAPGLPQTVYNFLPSSTANLSQPITIITDGRQVVRGQNGVVRTLPPGGGAQKFELGFRQNSEADNAAMWDGHGCLPDLYSMMDGIMDYSVDRVLDQSSPRPR